MQMPLILNAIDSLNWALKHLNNFLKKDPYFENREKSASDLKQAIINLNSCLELFFKKYISDSNEVLIYDFDKSSAAILDFYKVKAVGDTDLPMYDYFVMNNKSVITIPYSKCIDYFCEIYSVGKAYVDCFYNLNQLRNTIMHLGVNYKEQYYLLVGCIDKILWFLQYEILPKINLETKVSERLEISLLQIEGSFSEIGDTLWKQLYEQSINSIANKLESTFADADVQSHLQTKKRKVEFYATNDMEHSSARMTVKDVGLDEEMFCAYHDPLTRSLIINDGQKEAVVMAVFPLTVQGNIPQKFYCSKNLEGVVVNNIDHQSDFWGQPPYKNQFFYMDYSKQNLIKLMKMMIDYCDEVEFISV